MEGLNPTDPDDRRQIIKLMDGTARAWASRSKANPKTNPFYHVVLSWKEGEQPTDTQPTAAAAKAKTTKRFILLLAERKSGRPDTACRSRATAPDPDAADCPDEGRFPPFLPLNSGSKHVARLPTARRPS